MGPRDSVRQSMRARISRSDRIVQTSKSETVHGSPLTELNCGARDNPAVAHETKEKGPKKNLLSADDHTEKIFGHVPVGTTRIYL